jgi:hypothetical protein
MEKQQCVLRIPQLRETVNNIKNIESDATEKQQLVPSPI